MPTTFTPENSALLLIDHQVGTMQLIKNIDVEHAKRMSLALAKTASILGIPTVLTSLGQKLKQYKDGELSQSGVASAGGWTNYTLKKRRVLR